MLYLVLALVLAAFGLLIAALTTAATQWAWISVAVSVVAAALLLLDWLNGRRSAGEPATKPVTTQATEEAADQPAVEPIDEPEEASADTAAPAEPEPVGEPDEESTDAADLLIVSELSTEVLVVDEHPRYHRTSCPWLGGRATIPIAVSEARQLGFTPCARCGPDAVLAAEHRAAR